MVNVEGIDKAVLLHALVTSARPMGMGVLQARRFTLDEARQWINNGWSHDYDASHPDSKVATRRELYFDYVTGVPIKCRLDGDEVDPWGYDRDHGQGAFQRVVDSLKAVA